MLEQIYHFLKRPCNLVLPFVTNGSGRTSDQKVPKVFLFSPTHITVNQKHQCEDVDK
jgi:hypothetical protein